MRARTNHHNLAAFLTLLSATLPAQTQTPRSGGENPLGTPTSRGAVDKGSGVTGTFSTFLLPDLQRAQVENIIQRDADANEIFVKQREAGGYDLYVEKSDGLRRRYWVTQDKDGDIQILRTSFDADFHQVELITPESRLDAQRERPTKKWDVGPSFSLKAGQTIGEQRAAGWVVSPAGRAWKAEYQGHLIEIQGGLELDATGVSAVVSLDGPGASVSVGGVSSPFCEDGKLRAREFEIGASGGVGLYRIGMDAKGRVTLKVLGVGGSIASQYHLLDLSKLDPETRARLEKLCNPQSQQSAIIHDPKFSALIDSWVRAKGTPNSCVQPVDPTFDALVKDAQSRSERRDELSRAEGQQAQHQKAWLAQQRDIEDRRQGEREDDRRFQDRARGAQALADQAQQQLAHLKETSATPTPLDDTRARWQAEFDSARAADGQEREARARGLSKETASRWKDRLAEMKQRQKEALTAIGGAVGGPLGAAAGQAAGSAAGSSQSATPSEAPGASSPSDEVEVVPPVRVKRSELERGLRVESKTRIEYGPPPPPEAKPLPPPAAPQPTEQPAPRLRVILP